MWTSLSFYLGVVLTTRKHLLQNFLFCNRCFFIVEENHVLGAWYQKGFTYEEKTRNR